jgi:hypothetical protein
MSDSRVISDKGRSPVLAFRRHNEKGVLLQAGKSFIALSDSELTRLMEFLAVTPAVSHARMMTTYHQHLDSTV